MPAQQLFGLGGVRVADGDVAGTPGSDPVGKRQAVGLFKGMDDIQDAVARAGAQVDDLGARMVRGVFKRGQSNV